MKISSVTNGEKRIGDTGPHWMDGGSDVNVTRAQFRDYIEGINVKDHIGEGNSHNYHLEPWTVEIYEQASKSIQLD